MNDSRNKKALFVFYVLSFVLGHARLHANMGCTMTFDILYIVIIVDVDFLNIVKKFDLDESSVIV